MESVVCIDRQIVLSCLTLNGDGDADMEMPKRRPTLTPLNSTSRVHSHPTETNLAHDGRPDLPARYYV